MAETRFVLMKMKWVFEPILFMPMGHVWDDMTEPIEEPDAAMFKPRARKLVGKIYACLSSGSCPNKGAYFRAINPCSRAEADRVAECVYKDEQNTNVIGCMIDIVWIGKRESPIELGRWSAHDGGSRSLPERAYQQCNTHHKAGYYKR